MKQALIILGRYPHPGKVKTRLSKDLGNDVTAQFYKNLVEKLFLQIKTIKEIECFFCYADINDKELIDRWLKRKISLITPISNDVEENLSNAFLKLFEQNFDQIISIASDVPSINKQIIRKAFNNLNENDVVIGPDKSGGIYLYGTKKHYPEFFNNKLNIGETVFVKTINNIQNKKLTFVQLERLLDIDTIDDFNVWKNLNPNIDYITLSNYNDNT